MSVVDQLKLRILQEHGGPAGIEHGWNLTHGDSIMHREAVAEIERLRELAYSEGSRAVEYLRRARKA